MPTSSSAPERPTARTPTCSARLTSARCCPSPTKRQLRSRAASPGGSPPSEIAVSELTRGEFAADEGRLARIVETGEQAVGVRRLGDQHQPDAAVERAAQLV